MRITILIAIALLINSQSTFGQIRNNEKPNIIIINADDLGYGDLGCYGATKVKTPNIDRLAKEGRKFTDAHTASAVCSPSRYGLLTGQYPLRKNYWGPIPFSSPLTIDENTPTLGTVLKSVGYKTAFFGKWHLGFGDEKTDWNKPLKPGPLELGFDYYFGIPFVNSGPPFVYVENHGVVGYDPNDPFVLGEESVTQKWPAKNGYKHIGGAENPHMIYRDDNVGTTLKERSINWIKKTAKNNNENPFFLLLNTTNIHHPFTPAPQFKQTSEIGRYGDFIHELDWMVGEILNTLDDLNISDNTLVIFTSDNGGMLNHGGQDAWKAGHKLNGELLGFKFGAWEGGHRVPMITRWPNKIPENSVSDQLISQVDFFDTLSNLVGTSDTFETEDSFNQLETLLGNPKKPVRDYLIISPNSPQHLVVRTKKWSYIPAKNEGGFRGGIGNHSLGGAAAFELTKQNNSDIENAKVKESAPKAQLYNLEKDISQSTNVIQQNPKTAEKLHQIFLNYKGQYGKNKPIGWIDKRKQ